MAILSAVQQEEVTLGGVSEVGEFRIRNSAKAFSILSSGLYANKIKAIVRELSTNAVDSHFSAGRADTPFDVHLPNAIEPWFAIRDYGTGLDHDQVTQIYTTYFESTKTGSNDFVGALGLGSKSPFAYTDNFTITAVKDGVKRVYSAFINPQGIPSVAKMGEEASTELSGVEIKFSVNDNWEFSKFRDEAVAVYKYFKLRPVVSGSAEFQFQDVDYDVKDIAPGVHSMTRGRSVAVMGNIAYPIDLPQAQYKELGGLAGLLECSLEINFAIGDLDFQASREGLSYIPQTITAIKNKLEEINSTLTVRLTEEADAIDNLWQRTIFLMDRKDNYLWREAVAKYVTDTKFELMEVSSGGYVNAKPFNLKVADLASKYNIAIESFGKSTYGKGVTTHKTDYKYDTVSGSSVDHFWNIHIGHSVTFVKNDLKSGALTRAKYHFNNTKIDRHTTVVILSAADKTKVVDFDSFLADIKSPPNVMLASALKEKERKQRTASAENVTILTLQERDRGYSRRNEMVWADGGKAQDYDKTVTHVYVPLSGYTSLLESITDIKQLYHDLASSGIDALKNLSIHGVRKADLDFVKTQKNWVQLDKYITKSLKGINKQTIESMIVGTLDKSRFLKYNAEIVGMVTDPLSTYTVTVTKFSQSKSSNFNEAALGRILSKFHKSVTVDSISIIAKIKDEMRACEARYPLLKHMDYYTPADALAEYINLIDAKGNK